MSRASCVELRAALSEYLDGRQTLRQRHQTDRHLGRCHTCRAHLNELHRLAQLARSAPMSAPTPALAARVRQTLARRPQRHGADPLIGSARTVWWMQHRQQIGRAVAALLVIAACAGSYALGRRQTANHPSTASVAATVDRADLAARDREQFVRGASSLLDDIANLERIDEQLRLPLLQAQVRQLGLDRAARRWLQRDVDQPGDAALTQVAHLIEGIDPSAGHGHSVTIPAPAQATDLLTRLQDADRRVLARPITAFTPQIDHTLDLVAPNLSAPARHSLGNLLHLKESFIEGDADAARAFAGCWMELTTDRTAALVNDPFQPLIDRTLRRAIGDGPDEPAAGAGVRRRVDRIETPGGFEIRMVEESADGVSRVTIRRSVHHSSSN